MNYNNNKIKHKIKMKLAIKNDNEHLKINKIFKINIIFH